MALAPATVHAAVLRCACSLDDASHCPERRVVHALAVVVLAFFRAGAGMARRAAITSSTRPRRSSRRILAHRSRSRSRSRMALATSNRWPLAWKMSTIWIASGKCSSVKPSTARRRRGREARRSASGCAVRRARARCRYRGWRWIRWRLGGRGRARGALLSVVCADHEAWPRGSWRCRRAACHSGPRPRSCAPARRCLAEIDGRARVR